jgi:hypothetical protein
MSKNKKKAPKVKRVRVKKVVEVDKDTHLLELEVEVEHGHPPLAEPLPPEAIDLTVPVPPEDKKRATWGTWLRSFWKSTMD